MILLVDLSTSPPATIVLGAATVAHIALGLRDLRRGYEQDGEPCPPAVADLENRCRRSFEKSEGQAGSILFAELAKAHDASMPLLLTRSDVAEQLDVSVSTVKRLNASGALPVVKVGAATRIRRDDLESYVAAQDLSSGRDSQGSRARRRENGKAS